MDYIIPQQTKDKTCDCKKDMCCLMRSTKKCCEIAEFVSDDLIFIKGDGDAECLYCHSFGTSHFCSCPVRKEIFIRYKV